MSAHSRTLELAAEVNLELAREHFEERAAILEHDAGMRREDAEREARKAKPPTAG